MDFFLFVLLTAVLFIRPAEIVPDLLGWPIYNVCILLCIGVSLFRLLSQLSFQSLHRNPISFCVIAIWGCVVASHVLGRFYITGAVEAGQEFGKIVLYYGLLVSTIRSVQRLKSFVGWLCLLIGAVAALAVLNYHGVIALHGVETLQERRYDAESGEAVITPRLIGTGIYSDPNDLAMLCAFGMPLLFYACTVPEWRQWLPLSLGGIAVLVYAIALTHSRGGLLALMIGALVLLQSRFGWKRAIPFLVAIVPLALLAMGGRQTDFSALGDDTGQSRVQLWSDGLMLFRSHPFFGIGERQYSEEVGQVAHNSFIHMFVELGFLGGMCFLGAFIYSLRSIYLLGGREFSFYLPASILRLRPYLLGAIAAYGGGMLSLSRAYIAPTYMVLGLAAAFLRLAGATTLLPESTLRGPLLIQWAKYGGVFLVAAYLFVRVFANYGG